MENASKALIMAAEVLIGIMIISLGLYLYTTFSQQSAEMRKMNEEQQLVQFNTQFTVYLNRDDLTIYDIISVISLVRNNNAKYGNNTDDPNYIKVKIDNKYYEDDIEALNNKLSEDVDNIDENRLDDENGFKHGLPKYKCTDITYEDNARVNGIYFKENK